jgi:hypothetical protein
LMKNCDKMDYSRTPEVKKKRKLDDTNKGKKKKKLKYNLLNFVKIKTQ